MSDDPSSQPPDPPRRDPPEDLLRDRLAGALADRYALERELGEGGMATVYLAKDLKHHRQVAINSRAVGEPVELFSRDDFGFTQPFRAFDVSADGEHILGILGTPPEAPPEPEIHLGLNWFEELREGAGGR